MRTASNSASGSAVRMVMASRVLRQLVFLLRCGDKAAVRRILVKAGLKVLNTLLLPLGLLLTLVMRLARPWLLVRINILTSERIGHFAGNAELYLCERDAGINAPQRRYVDLWYHSWPICNQQLARMWGRVLHVWPRWLLAPVQRVNSLLPNGAVHRIGVNSGVDRDVLNLLDRMPSHLNFSPEEEMRGQAGLRALGIPANAPFVCLTVRDSSYLAKSIPWKSWNYHDYRDCDIQNYVLAALELTNRGYYVVRMGAVVKEAMNVSHPMIIDYAVNGMRTDFMDIYLGAKCDFCISAQTGFDAVPYIFRRPIVYVDQVPLGVLMTFSSRFLAIPKKHWLREKSRFMTVRETFESGAARFAHSNKYESLGIDLIESTPEEIVALVLEMESRLKGTWQTTDEDEALQCRFWDIYRESMAYDSTSRLHGEIRSRIGAAFLRGNRILLE